MAFSPDGTLLASASWDGTVRLWDVSPPELAWSLGPPLTGHTDVVESVAFSPDGTLVASGSDDGTVRLWDVALPDAPVALGPSLTGHTSRVMGVAFSPSGMTLASAGLDGAIILWDVDVASWQDRACRIANRNMTQVEWEQAFASAPYAKTCAQLPADPSAVWTIMAQADDQATAGNLAAASAALSRAAQLVVDLDDAELNFRVCLLGIVENLARDTLSACRRAVELAPDGSKPRLGVGLGMARALIGDYAPAVVDLQAFVAWAKQNGTEDSFTGSLEGAIPELEAGRNPFTPDWLTWLRGQLMPGLFIQQ